MLRLLILVGLYGMSFALLAIGVSLGVSALSKGALPHVWLWATVLVGGALLFRALRLTRRFGDKSAWRRHVHTPRSLFTAGVGTCCIVIAAVVGGRTGFGRPANLLGGLLLIIAEIQKRARR